MDISFSKVESSQHDGDRHASAMASDTKNTNSAREIESWEEIYRERFARGFTFSRATWFPFWNFHWVNWETKLKPFALKFGPPSTYANFHWTTPRYAGPTPEPLSAELVARTRHELIRSYHEETKFRELQMCLRETWSTNGALSFMRVPYLSQGDTLAPDLLKTVLLHPPWYNQTTAVYFEPDFMRCWSGQCWQEGDGMDEYYGLGCRYIGRALLAAWLDLHHYYGETPNLQQARYFAKPYLLDAQPGQRGATAVHTHKAICEELESNQNKPASPKDPYTWVDHGCEMGPIYRSVIIVVDKQQPLRGSPDAEEQRFILFHQCSVLLVRTGDEDHLSAPIDLSTLTAAGLSLPLARSLHEAALVDPDGKQQVVRVRLGTAVRFIMDLERREREASARLTAMKNVLDADTFREADTWVSAVLANAEKNGGIDEDEDTWRAVRLAQAHLNGDRCGLEGPPLEEMPGHNLRSWWHEIVGWIE